MITSAILLSIAPRGKRAIIDGIAPHLGPAFERADIITPLRAAHFLAQAAHECDGFKTMREYASGKAYEGRRDLGNTQKGDGVRYKGRGIFQLTGRANYRAIGKALNLPLEETPELAEDPRNAVLIAVNYWMTRKQRGRSLNDWADVDNIESITRAINGGLNGLEDRKRYLARAKTALGVKG
jgi:putative chitinase